jgi:hypothetical protein
MPNENCTQCLKRPRADGISRCKECRDNEKSRYETLKAQGICVSCATNDAFGDYTKCLECSSSWRKNRMRIKLQRIKRKMCTDCGNAPALLPITTRCSSCRDVANAAVIRSRQKKASQRV